MLQLCSSFQKFLKLYHDLESQDQTTFDLRAEIGAQALALDPQRAEGISYYNTGQTVKNALGLK